jgi:general secretion pathway protein N
MRALALALLLLLCLLATAPARLLGLVLPSVRVTMQGFSGTLWRGQASRCLVQTPAGFLHLGVVKWHLNPLSLILFSPQLSLNSGWGSQIFNTELVLHGGQDVDLKALEATIPADLLRQFVPVELAGVLQLRSEYLELRDGLPVAGKGRLVWLNGGWDSPSGPVPLGSYALDFSQSPDAALLGEVLTLAGEVNAQGSIELQGSAYGVDITVQSEVGLDGRLQQALSLVARPVESGFHIVLNGDF